jgi:hypothetical protein
MADTSIDWSSWTKTRPLNVDALDQFNAMGVDPYTALVAGALCERFKFSSHGDQNIGHAFGALPVAAHTSVFGIRYPPRHIAPLLLRSDSGSSFLAICGVLCEYYPCDLVVGFFKVMASRSNLPFNMMPTTAQWTELIETCAGTLATSEFGTIITKYAQACEATISSDPVQVADWLLAINSKATQALSGDGPFLAAVSEWLFSRDFVIQTETSTDTVNQSKLIIHAKKPGQIPTAGRVHWNSVFRTCFGQAWRELDKETLTGIIAAASGMTHATLLQSGRNPKTFFLHHEIGIPQLAGYGVNETILAWFAELRPLGPGIPRFHKSHHYDGDQAHPYFDIGLKELEKKCSCSSCGDGSSVVCKVSLAETIVGLGLYVARMVVVPNLYPKVSGIQAFYRMLHENRLTIQKPDVSHCQYLIQGLVEDLPTPQKMLEVACTLFTGVTSPSLSGNIMSIRLYGFHIIITYLKFNPDDPPDSRPAASVQVCNGGFSFYDRFVRADRWDPGVANMSIEEAFENIKSRPKEMKQIVKMENDVKRVSAILLNQGLEAKAEEQGWMVF